MGSGGSRYGAGRPSSKMKTGELKSIDVRVFAKLGYLDRFHAFSWKWTRNGEPTGNIAIHVEPKSYLTLRYTITINEQLQTHADRVYLVYTPCNYGKSRPWLVCPRCDRRLAKLYMRGGRFACRHCQKVAYSSQSEDEIDRTWRIQRKIEARIGDKYLRPKGMRLRTFDKLVNELFHCQNVRNAAVDVMADRLIGRLKRLDAR